MKMEESPPKVTQNGKGEFNQEIKLCEINIFKFLAHKNKRNDEFKYGNYRNYYFKRLGSENTDIRLELMEQHPEYFKDKRILDIGCNSGWLTVNVAKKLQPKIIMGIDIDAQLINTARRDVDRQRIAPNLTENDQKSLNSVIFRTVRINC